jgi:hypothetical protein
MKNKPHLIMFLAFSLTLILVIALASCEPAIASSSDNKKPCGKIISQEQFEAKVAIDTTNISEEEKEYDQSVYNQ